MTALVSLPDAAGATGTPAAGRALRPTRGAELWLVAARAVKVALRNPEAVIPNLFIGLFFFAVNVGSMQHTIARTAHIDAKAFELPVAIMFAVTGTSRATQAVVDIANGYFDRLLMTPIRRTSLLFGMLLADFLIALGLAVCVSGLAVALGVRFASGVGGFLVFLVFASAWSTAYSGFVYALAFASGSPETVNSAGFMIFFPFAFLTTAFLPRDLLAGWMSSIAEYNPVTYFLSALRSLIVQGWHTSTLLGGLAAILGVGVVGFLLALKTLAGRIAKG
ncbi:ABC-2 type transport system permease protein [Catenulispora sp. GAS73]|uniref:ABC transporter permease n=1 Tax=Catenulispora sp. GAS73 TaxID=3156269 RepID=UPI003515CCE1